MTEHIQITKSQYEEYQELLDKDDRKGYIAFITFSVAMLTLGLSIGLGTLAATQAQSPSVAWGFFLSVAAMSFGFMTFVTGAVEMVYRAVTNQNAHDTVNKEGQ